MTTPEMTSNTSPTLDELSTEDFLLVVGQRIRQQRARKSMSRRRLAEVSKVSERYLAQLESGQGNMSIALLRKVTSAIGISMGSLMSEEVVEACARKLSPPSVSVVPSSTGEENVPAPSSESSAQREPADGVARPVGATVDSTSAELA